MRLEKKGYVLLEAEKFPAIQSEEYDFVKKLSFSTIRNIHTRDVDLEKRTLKILSKDKKE